MPHLWVNHILPWASMSWFKLKQNSFYGFTFQLSVLLLHQDGWKHLLCLMPLPGTLSWALRNKSCGDMVLQKNWVSQQDSFHNHYTTVHWGQLYTMDSSALGQLYTMTNSTPWTNLQWGQLYTKAASTPVIALQKRQLYPRNNSTLGTTFDLSFVMWLAQP